MDERGQRRRPPAAARARHLVFVLSGSDRPCQFAVVRVYGSHTSGTSMLPRSAVSRGTSANVARRTEPTSRCSSPARPDQTRRRGRPKLVQLQAKRQPTVRTRRPPGLCDGTVRSLTSIAPVARCEPRPRALPRSVVSGRVWAIAVVPGSRRDPATLFGVVQTCFRSCRWSGQVRAQRVEDWFVLLDELHRCLAARVIDVVDRVRPRLQLEGAALAAL